MTNTPVCTCEKPTFCRCMMHGGTCQNCGGTRPTPQEAKQIIQEAFTGPEHEEAVRKAAVEGAEDQNRALEALEKVDRQVGGALRALGGDNETLLKGK